MCRIGDAKRIIPDLVIIQAHMELYREKSIQIFEQLKKECDGCIVQVSGIDEAYVDATSVCQGDFPLKMGEELAERIRKSIFNACGFTLSAGISHNRFLSKLAAGRNKPNGQATIAPHEIREILDDMPIRRIPGVGSTYDKKLATAGIRLIRHVRELPSPMVTLSPLVGEPLAKLIINLCDGIDDSKVEDKGAPKSLSSELTFLPIETLCMVQEKLEIINDDLAHRIERDRERYNNRVPTRLCVKYATDNYGTNLTSISSEKNSLLTIRKMTKEEVKQFLNQLSFSLTKSKLTVAFKMFRLSVTVYDFTEVNNNTLERFVKKRSAQEEEDHRLAIQLHNEQLEQRLSKRQKTSHTPNPKKGQQQLTSFFKKT
jgi:nucleotidyltransferase/DNA polymerase involved in DNA repair